MSESHRHRYRRSGTSALLLAVLGACTPAGDTGSESEPVELPLFTVGEPTVQIGVVEGAEEYTFAAIENVVERSDGSIVVADAGATRVSVFDADGAFVRSWGQQGGGPGEFRSLSRVYALPGDSLMAAERSGLRVAVYGPEGELVREASGVSLSGDSLFTLDSWLHGRFWVEGVLHATERARVTATLAALPVPRAGAGYRVIRVDQDGRLWVREPGEAGTTETTWTRLTPEGRPEAVVETPAGYRPTWMRGDRMLGVWRGESDVEFVRAYGLAETEVVRPIPAWLTGAESAATMEVPPTEQELLDRMRAQIRSMAGAQEMQYARSRTYTPRVEELEDFEAPDDLVIDFVRGDPRGWGVIFSHPSMDRLCALTYGFGTPPGWVPGSITCAPRAAAAPSDASGEDR